jgi:hypothetical protein
MGYRDASESLRAYRNRVAADLDEARRAAKEAADRAAQVQVLEKELAETDGLIVKMGGGRASLPLLEDLTIAAPCTANWDDMKGDEHVRFCAKCEKNVYNLSSLPRDEAEALLAAKEGRICVRLYRRHDGTVLTSDCPVGVKHRRRRRVAIAAAVGGTLVAAAAGVAAQATATLGGATTVRPTFTPDRQMGAVYVPPTVDTGSTDNAHPWTMGTVPAQEPPAPHRGPGKAPRPITR